MPNSWTGPQNNTLFTHTRIPTNRLKFHRGPWSYWSCKTVRCLCPFGEHHCLNTLLSFIPQSLTALNMNLYSCTWACKKTIRYSKKNFNNSWLYRIDSWIDINRCIFYSPNYIVKVTLWAIIWHGYLLCPVFLSDQRQYKQNCFSQQC